jgi:hypothetical protein
MARTVGWKGYANHDFLAHDLHESFYSKSIGQLYTRATRKHRSGYMWQGTHNTRMLGSRSD